MSAYSNIPNELYKDGYSEVNIVLENEMIDDALEKKFKLSNITDTALVNGLYGKTTYQKTLLLFYEDLRNLLADMQAYSELLSSYDFVALKKIQYNDINSAHWQMMNFTDTSYKIDSLTIIKHFISVKNNLRDLKPFVLNKKRTLLRNRRHKRRHSIIRLKNTISKLF